DVDERDPFVRHAARSGIADASAVVAAARRAGAHGLEDRRSRRRRPVGAPHRVRRQAHRGKAVIVFSAGLVLSLLIQTAQPSLTLRAAVERLTTSTSNEQRFEAMTALLRARNIPFAVERFTIAQPVGAEPRTEGRNIVASFGTGAAQTVVGAHYDAARIPGGALSRGAIDNAASSVVLLQLADAFRSQPPTGRVTLVWFDMEEIGLVGSSRYVE